MYVRACLCMQIFIHCKSWQFHSLFVVCLYTIISLTNVQIIYIQRTDCQTSCTSAINLRWQQSRKTTFRLLASRLGFLLFFIYRLIDFCFTCAFIYFYLLISILFIAAFFSIALSIFFVFFPSRLFSFCHALAYDQHCLSPIACVLF